MMIVIIIVFELLWFCDDDVDDSDDVWGRDIIPHLCFMYASDVTISVCNVVMILTWNDDDDIGAVKGRWVIEYDCWCDTDDDDENDKIIYWFWRTIIGKINSESILTI